SSGYAPQPHALQTAVESLWSTFDAVNGGFGRAPKFPMPTVYPLLLRSWYRDRDPRALRMEEQSLAAMRAGGIFDQLGFGFHRYATDARWNIPHFEKMLYDQALLALAYTDAWQATGEEMYRRTARETLAYVKRDLALPGGAFASAEDADSEGQEGKFYLWTAGEIRAAIGEPKAAELMRRYGVTERGNFPDQGAAVSGTAEGENVLYLEQGAAGSLSSTGASGSSAPEGPEESRLLEVRSTRPRPSKDDKVLTDWNGLVIAALARAGSTLGDDQTVSAAEDAARFVLRHLQKGGRLLHRYRDGQAAIPGFADDYAFFSWALMELYEATFETTYLQQAIHLMDTFSAHFWDRAAGGFFQTADDSGESGARRKPFTDGAVPSANSVALLVLLRLNRITGNQDYERKAETLIRQFPPDAAARPLEFSFFLSAADFSAGPSFEVVVSGAAGAPDTDAMLRALRTPYLPNAVVIFRPAGARAPDTSGRTGPPPGPDITKLAPFTETQEAIDGHATAYVCQNFVCNLPTTQVATMLAELRPR
ncbi:MAG TPA: thioredoxin domain-containing protein, partial [Spirochaetia bacterium]|nr:thioredoxin domain-containing protein [Spirochaetia bacterium]